MVIIIRRKPSVIRISISDLLALLHEARDIGIRSSPYVVVIEVKNVPQRIIDIIVDKEQLPRRPAGILIIDGIKRDNIHIIVIGILICDSDLLLRQLLEYLPFIWSPIIDRYPFKNNGLHDVIHEPAQFAGNLSLHSNHVNIAGKFTVHSRSLNHLDPQRIYLPPVKIIPLVERLPARIDVSRPFLNKIDSRCTSDDAKRPSIPVAIVDVPERNPALFLVYAGECIRLDSIELAVASRKSRSDFAVFFIPDKYPARNNNAGWTA